MGTTRRALLMCLLLPSLVTGCCGTFQVQVVGTPTAAPATELPAVEPTRAFATEAPVAAPTHTPAGTPLPPDAWPAPKTELVNEAGRWQLFTSANQVNDLALAGGSLWAATQGGLVRWDIEDGAYAKYTVLDGLPSNSVNVVEVGPDGVLWVGGYDWLARWDGREWSRYEEAHGTIHDVAAEPNGVLWVGTDSYLARYDGTEWTTYGQRDGLAGDACTSIAVDPGGDVWVGHYGLMSRWDGQAWITHTVAYTVGVGGVAVTDIVIGPDGAVWVSTAGRGVSRWDGSAWVRYTKEDGLADNDVLAVAVGADGSVERLIVSRYGVGDLYGPVWDPDGETEWACLRRPIHSGFSADMPLTFRAELAYKDVCRSGGRSRLSASIAWLFLCRAMVVTVPWGVDSGLVRRG